MKPFTQFRTVLAPAARFWEPRRLLYNTVLTAVALYWIHASWPHFRPAIALPTHAP